MHLVVPVVFCGENRIAVSCYCLGGSLFRVLCLRFGCCRRWTQSGDDESYCGHGHVSSLEVFCRGCRWTKWRSKRVWRVPWLRQQIPLSSSCSTARLWLLPSFLDVVLGGGSVFLCSRSSHRRPPVHMLCRCVCSRRSWPVCTTPLFDDAVSIPFPRVGSQVAPVHEHWLYCGGALLLCS